MPLGSVVGPPFLKIYLNDLFYLKESTIINCTDGTTFYSCNKDLNSLINRFMKIKRQSRCLLLTLGFKTEMFGAEIGETKIWENKKQKLLHVESDRTLSFDEYVASLCKKGGKKLSV